MSNNLKNRISKLEGPAVRMSIHEQVLNKHCRKNGHGMPLDKGVMLKVVTALAFKEDPEHPRYAEAINTLKWASTRPDLELLERSDQIWSELVDRGVIPSKPAPWCAEPADPCEVMPPFPLYMTSEQLERSWAKRMQ